MDTQESVKADAGAIDGAGSINPAEAQEQPIRGSRRGMEVKKIAITGYTPAGTLEIYTHLKFRDRAELNGWLEEHGVAVLDERWTPGEG